MRIDISTAQARILLQLLEWHIENLFDEPPLFLAAGSDQVDEIHRLKGRRLALFTYQELLAIRAALEESCREITEALLEEFNLEIDDRKDQLTLEERDL